MIIVGHAQTQANVGEGEKSLTQVAPESEAKSANSAGKVSHLVIE
jgi:hypothetical protein